MAETISDIAPRGARYPWEQWTNGKAWRATQGADFQCSVEGFAAVIYSHARRRGLRVTVSVLVDGCVDFQFSKPIPERSRKNGKRV